LLAAPASTRVRVDEGDRGAGLAYLEGEALLQIEPDGVGGVAAVADREVLAAHEVEVAPPLADDDGAVDGPGPHDGTAEHEADVLEDRIAAVLGGLDHACVAARAEGDGVGAADAGRAQGRHRPGHDRRILVVVVADLE